MAVARQKAGLVSASTWIWGLSPTVSGGHWVLDPRRLSRKGLLVRKRPD